MPGQEMPCDTIGSTRIIDVVLGGKMPFYGVNALLLLHTHAHTRNHTRTTTCMLLAIQCGSIKKFHWASCNLFLCNQSIISVSSKIYRPKFQGRPSTLSQLCILSIPFFHEILKSTYYIRKM